MKTTIQEKLNALSNEDLIRLSKELRLTVIPEDAFAREVIKDTELNGSVITTSIIIISQHLSFILAERLEYLIDSQDYLFQ